MSNFGTRITNALHRTSFTIRQSHSKAKFTIKKQMEPILLLTAATELLCFTKMLLRKRGYP